MMTYGEAIREAMSIRMREDPNVILFGEDVGAFGGCFGVSAGMFDEFGPERVRDTPISEGAIIGSAVGSAATGLRPIAELMFNDFLTVGMDQLVNQAAKMRYMFGGKIDLPMVVRLPAGGRTGGAAQHSQSLEAWLTHVPGLKVVYPSNAQDALGLLLSAIDDDNPVMFFEQKTLYATKSEVTSKDPIPLGKGKIVREGKDVTIVTYAKQVYDAEEAAKKLAADGIEAEIIDIRSLYPLDKDMIAEVHSQDPQGHRGHRGDQRGGYGGEISAIIGEEMFDDLDAPVARIGALDTPVPFAPNLEDVYLPNATDIVLAAKKMF
jgi:pyruvate dehydrogenase E1 component beta subunit